MVHDLFNHSGFSGQSENAAVGHRDLLTSWSLPGIKDTDTLVEKWLLLFFLLLLSEQMLQGCINEPANPVVS